MALGFSPHLPVSVCGTGASINRMSFSRQCTITHFATYFRSLTPWSTIARVGLCSCVPHTINDFWRLRNFNRMCISYASRPRLSSRLTLSGRTFLRKPQIFGHYDSHIILATHSGILTPASSSSPSGLPSHYCRTLLYHLHLRTNPKLRCKF